MTEDELVSTGYYTQSELDQHLDAAKAAGKAEAWNNYRGEMEAINPNGNYIDPEAVSDDAYNGASDTLAKLHRAQWSDWKARFQPRLEQLAGYAQSGELTQQSVGLAKNAVTNNFAGMAAAQQRRNQSLGIQATGMQKAANDRIMGLTQAAATTEAMNRARIAGQDRDMQILAGGGGISSNFAGAR